MLGLEGVRAHWSNKIVGSVGSGSPYGRGPLPLWNLQQSVGGEDGIGEDAVEE